MKSKRMKVEIYQETEPVYITETGDNYPSGYSYIDSEMELEEEFEIVVKWDESGEIEVQYRNPHDEYHHDDILMYLEDHFDELQQIETIKIEKEYEPR